MIVSQNLQNFEKITLNLKNATILYELTQLAISYKHFTTSETKQKMTKGVLTMLDSALLAQEIMSKIQASGFKPTEENQKFAQAISQAIIEHIIKNAVVTTTGSATAQTGKIT